MKGFVYDGLPVTELHIALLVACGLFVVAAIVGNALGWDRKRVFAIVGSIFIIPLVFAFIAGGASLQQEKAADAYSESVKGHVAKTADIKVISGDIGIEPGQLYMMTVTAGEYDSACGATMPEKEGGDVTFQCGDEGVALDKAKETIIAEGKARAEQEAAELKEEESAAAEEKK